MENVKGFSFPAWESFQWRDVPENPLVAPFNEARFKGVVGDPQIILPGEFDDRWHMFVWHNNKGCGFARFDSTDGMAWEFVYSLPWDSMPAYVFNDGTQWIAYYTHKQPKEMLPVCDNKISARVSNDLEHWSGSIEILLPEFDWEREGKRIQVRNPCVCLLPNGVFRLYYSGGTVWMNDMNFEEPKYIGMAESKSPLGPFIKRTGPIISPSSDIPHRNYGAGAIKVYRLGNYFLAILNGIYLDREQHSRSALNVLLSLDGIDWKEAPYNPIIPPNTGWKKALVYQLDLRYYQGKLLMYYNARDEWLNGKECIGLSTLAWAGEIPEKMWGLKRK